MRPTFGLILPQGWRNDLSQITPSAQYPMIRTVALEAEKLKFDSLYLYDHLHAVPFSEGQPCFECWTTMAALASETKHIRIGSLVTCNSYRNPALLAKMASTLDNISGGRLEFGIGAGWLEEEHRAYGFSFPSAGERIRRLDESITLIKKLWTSDGVDFSGEYYTAKNATSQPKPVQKPHPPVMIGGIGENLLRVVAKHADIWNFQGSLDELEQKLQLLMQHCRRVGRTPDGIIRSLYATVVIGRDQSEVKDRLSRFLSREKGGRNALSYYLSEIVRDPGRAFEKVWKISQGRVGKTVIVGTPQQCLEQLLGYSKLGVSHFVAYVSDSTELTPLEILADDVVKYLR